jgi:hypothetical protein
MRGASAKDRIVGSDKSEAGRYQCKDQFEDEGRDGVNDAGQKAGGRYKFKSKFINQRNGESVEPARGRRCARRGSRCDSLLETGGTRLHKIKNGRGNSAPAIFLMLDSDYYCLAGTL